MKGKVHVTLAPLRIFSPPKGISLILSCHSDTFAIRNNDVCNFSREGTGSYKVIYVFNDQIKQTLSTCPPMLIPENSRHWQRSLPRSPTGRSAAMSSWPLGMASKAVIHTYSRPAMPRLSAASKMDRVSCLENKQINK